MTNGVSIPWFASGKCVPDQNNDFRSTRRNQCSTGGRRGADTPRINCLNRIALTNGLLPAGLHATDAHRDDGKRFVGRADEKLTAFLDLEKITRESLRF
jgi:hypothetical protein